MQAHRVHSVLPDMIASLDWQLTDCAAPILPPFTGQPGIQVETANITTPLKIFLAVFHKTSVSIDCEPKQFIQTI